MVAPAQPVFLILDGRVNCLLTRNLCFKTYVKGSYFGDFEFFRNCTRLFSVRAEVPTTLMMISCETLASTFNSFPEAVMVVMKRSLQRYMRYQLSIRLIKKYGMVTMNDEYWTEDIAADKKYGSLILHQKIENWLSRIAKIKQDMRSE